MKLKALIRKQGAYLPAVFLLAVSPQYSGCQSTSVTGTDPRLGMSESELTQTRGRPSHVARFPADDDEPEIVIWRYTMYDEDVDRYSRRPPLVFRGGVLVGVGVSEIPERYRNYRPFGQP